MRQVAKQLFFEDCFKELANNRLEANWPDFPWACCTECFCDWGYYCMAPVIRNLCNLKGKVKHPDKYMEL